MPRDEQKEQFPLIPAVIAQPGHYAHAIDGNGTWEYIYDIHAARTRSECRIGLLRANGLAIAIATARPGDRILTPWGPMLRVEDHRYERGFLLERTPGSNDPLPPGSQLPVPDELLARDGVWEAQVGPWSYSVAGRAMGSKSERRIGKLRFGPFELRGDKQGDYVNSPWGPLRWMDVSQIDTLTDYEQGFLLRGTFDRPLGDLEGDIIYPSIPALAVHLRSMYLDRGFFIAEGSRPVHSVSLALSGSPDREVELRGVLTLDPNQCTLNEFGDRMGCTKMGFQRVEVSVVRQRLGDPLELDRRFFAVTGSGLPAMTLIVQEALQHCYLKLDRQLIALYPESA